MGRKQNQSTDGRRSVAARFMRQDFFEYRPQFKLDISGNHKPSLRSVDEAIRRRFNLIPFTVTIPEEERDPELGGRPKDELPGILAWAIQGCLIIWQAEGLRAPKTVTEATEAYLHAEDLSRRGSRSAASATSMRSRRKLNCSARGRRGPKHLANMSARRRP